MILKMFSPKNGERIGVFCLKVLSVFVKMYSLGTLFFF
jgi:hypothetical protein